MSGTVIKSLLPRTAIVLFWLAMNFWLFRYEAFPEKFSSSAEGYRSLMPSGPLILDSWMQIEYQDLPVGYSHTWIDTDLSDPESAYLLRNQTILNVQIMGQNQGVGITLDATLDDQYALQRFTVALHSGVYSARVEAGRVRKNIFRVTADTPPGSRTFEMEIPENAVLFSPMLEMAMQKLAPGQQLKLKTVDPISLALADVIMEGAGRERIVVDGKPVEAVKINVSCQGLTFVSWFDDQGRLLREETPFGWTLRASSPGEVLSQKRKK